MYIYVSLSILHIIIIIIIITDNTIIMTIIIIQLLQQSFSHSSYPPFFLQICTIIFSIGLCNNFFYRSLQSFFSVDLYNHLTEFDRLSESPNRIRSSVCVCIKRNFLHLNSLRESRGPNSRSLSWPTSPVRDQKNSNAIYGLLFRSSDLILCNKLYISFVFKGNVIFFYCFIVSF